MHPAVEDSISYFHYTREKKIEVQSGEGRLSSCLAV